MRLIDADALLESIVKNNIYADARAINNAIANAPTVESPPKREWRGLSDEDILKILGECAVSPYAHKQSAFGYVKSIEAKLKEVNGYD